MIYFKTHSISEQYNTYYETSVHFNVYMGRVTTKSVQLVKEWKGLLDILHLHEIIFPIFKLMIIKFGAANPEELAEMFKVLSS